MTTQATQAQEWSSNTSEAVRKWAYISAVSVASSEFYLLGHLAIGSIPLQPLAEPQLENSPICPLPLSLFSPMCPIRFILSEMSGFTLAEGYKCKRSELSLLTSKESFHLTLAVLIE